MQLIDIFIQLQLWRLSIITQIVKSQTHYLALLIVQLEPRKAKALKALVLMSLARKDFNKSTVFKIVFKVTTIKKTTYMYLMAIKTKTQ